MKILLAVSLVYVGLIGLTPLASGQGTVTYTPLSADQFTIYQDMSVWSLLLDVGGSGFLSNNAQTNTYSHGLNIAYAATIFVLAGTDGLTVTNNITNGRFNSTGGMAGTSLNTMDTLSGIVIAMSDAYYQSDGNITLSDLYLGNNYQPDVATLNGDAITGIICTFSEPTSVYDLSFALNQPNGGGEEHIYVFGIAAVPEPSLFALIGLGGLALVARLIKSRA